MAYLTGASAGIKARKIDQWPHRQSADPHSADKIISTTGQKRVLFAHCVACVTANRYLMLNFDPIIARLLLLVALSLGLGLSRAVI
jgi:hypothetical protein